VSVKQDMDVVGHDHVSMQDVAAKLGAAKDGILGVGGELGVGQPEGAGAS